MKRILIIIIAAVLSWSASGQIVSQGGMTTYKIKKEIRKSPIKKGGRWFTDVAFGGYPLGYGMDAEISGIYGWQFNNFFFLGGGLRLTSTIGKDELVALSPIINFKTYFTTTRVIPLVALELGYNIGLNTGNALYSDYFSYPCQSLTGFTASLGLGFEYKYFGFQFVVMDIDFISTGVNTHYKEGEIGLLAKFSFNF